MRTCPVTLATLATAVLTAACNAAGPAATVPPSEAGPSSRSQPSVVHVAGHDLTTPAPGADTEAADTEPVDTEVADVGGGAPAGHADPAPGDEPPAPDGPAAAAAGLLVDLLAVEGLLVTSIDTHLERHDGDEAQVLVDVAHSGGLGHPVQSRYLLELVRESGRWRLVGFSEPD